MIHPVILGNGKRLFQDGTAPARLRLADTKTTTKGVLILTYEPAREGEQVAVPVGETAAAESH